MAKAIPKKGSRGRIGSRKSTRKIPKGVIHIQASFNNTIVTVTDSFKCVDGVDVTSDHYVENSQLNRMNLCF